MGKTLLFILVTAAHLGVLAWIGMRAPLTRMRPIDPPIVMAYLMPPTPPRPRPPPLGVQPQQVVVAPYRPRLIVPVAPLEVAPIPAPVEALTPAGDVELRPAPAPLPPVWDGVKDAVRTSPVGCAERDRVGLTRAERAVCDEKWGGLQVEPIPLSIDPVKKAGFDQAAAAKTQARREREGSMAEPMTTCSGPMSNFGVACNR